MNTATPKSPLLILQARAEARALLLSTCEYADLDEAVEPLLSYAVKSGLVDDIGADNVWALIAAAFRLVPNAEG
jgi:hypothetical protein